MVVVQGEAELGRRETHIQAGETDLADQERMGSEKGILVVGEVGVEDILAVVVDEMSLEEGRLVEMCRWVSGGGASRCRIVVGMAGAEAGGVVIECGDG